MLKLTETPASTDGGYGIIQAKLTASEVDPGR